MKFHLPLTTAVSAAILATAGCGSSDREWQTDNDTKVCVDKDGKRVAESQCFNQTGGGFAPYRWYFLSRGGYVPYYGYPVTGGSWTPSGAPSSYGTAPASAPAGAITRGGFGSIGEGHAASHGGGEGGGE